jgi:hypothetical protein
LVGVQQAFVGPRHTVQPGPQLLVGGAVMHRSRLCGCGEALELRHQPLRAGEQAGDMAPHSGLDLLGLDDAAWAGCRACAQLGFAPFGGLSWPERG